MEKWDCMYFIHKVYKMSVPVSRSDCTLSTCVGRGKCTDCKLRKDAYTQIRGIKDDIYHQGDGKIPPSVPVPETALHIIHKKIDDSKDPTDVSSELSSYMAARAIEMIILNDENPNMKTINGHIYPIKCVFNELIDPTRHKFSLTYDTNNRQLTFRTEDIKGSEIETATFKKDNKMDPAQIQDEIKRVFDSVANLPTQADPQVMQDIKFYQGMANATRSGNGSNRSGNGSNRSGNGSNRSGNGSNRSGNGSTGSGNGSGGTKHKFVKKS
jgi:uncharacterized membrane protein YgcG